jgi:hypothetical protein
VHGGTECVAHAELHNAGDDLGQTAHEQGETEDGLVRSNGAKGVGIGETTQVIRKGALWW